MAASTEVEGGFVTTSEAALILNFSRAGSFLRAWRAAGLRTFRRPSGRILVAETDVARFVTLDEDAER